MTEAEAKAMVERRGDCLLCGRLPWYWRGFWHNQISGPMPLVMRAQRMTRSQAVYVLATPSGFFKIGIARNPEWRVRELQTGCPEKIDFQGATIIADWGADPREMEAEAHRLLAGYRTSGEWFKAPPEVVYRAFHEAWCKVRHPGLYARWLRFCLHVRAARQPKLRAARDAACAA